MIRRNRSRLHVLILPLIFFWVVSASGQGGDVHFATGFRIGEVTQHAAVVWTRLTSAPERNWEGIVFQPKDSRTRVMVEIPDIPVSEWEGSAEGTGGQVRVLYSSSANLSKGKATAWSSVDPDADYTHQFVLDGLEPNTRYHLIVEGRSRRGGSVTKSARGGFQTPADPGDLQDVMFTVSSCQMYSHRDHRLGYKIYESMLRAFAKMPDFMVRAGDSVYYDRDNPRGKTPDLCRLHWQRQYSLPFLRDFHAHVSCYWLKDDHDSFFDDCWREYEAPWIEPLTYEEAEMVFKEQTPSPREKRYRTVRWGQNLQIWLMEGRDFRSPNDMPDGPEKSIWGKEQKAWLKKTLVESDATFKVIINPTAIVGPDSPTQEDNHADVVFSHEGNEFRQFTKDSNLRNLYIINGDRHWQYMSTDPKSGLREFACGPSSNQHSVGGPGYDIKYHSYYRPAGGFISVTVTRGEKKVLIRPQRVVFEDSVPTINIRFHDVDGKIMHEFRETVLSID